LVLPHASEPNRSVLYSSPVRSRPRSLLALAAAASLAIAAAGCGGGDDQAPVAAGAAAAAQRSVDYRLYWAGRSFEGLPLTGVRVEPRFTSLVYGTCDANTGREGGCVTPLELQIASICDRNALLLDIRPRAILHSRGVPVLDYGDDLSLEAGASQVTVFADARRGRRAIAALRAVEGSQRARADLPQPRYPRYYLDQLRRVRAAYARLGSLRAVRDALRISRSAVRFELRLARGIAAARLRAARGADPGLREIKRERVRRLQSNAASHSSCELEPPLTRGE
jgi:hypothetical protein